MDKLLHFIISLLATFIATSLISFLGEAPALIGGSLLAIGLGLGKEYGDSKAPGNKWDWWDIAADLLGIATAVILMLFLWPMMVD